MTTLVEAASEIQKFAGSSLKDQISNIEAGFSAESVDKSACEILCTEHGITSSLLASALILKQASSQINVVVHAIGMLLALPRILYDSEVVETLSLGAGNTGRPFDLETNLRIAEFKFIAWKGADSIRQNSIFKDFYRLAETETAKQRFLYVLQAEYPLTFLNGGRALRSVMSRDRRLADDFDERYGEQFSKVNEYYHFRKDRVSVVDLATIIPEFVSLPD